MKGRFVTICAVLCLGACGGNNGSNNGASNNGASNNAGSNNGASNNAGSNNGGSIECPDDNPLVGSCGDLNFLGGCFEPDMSGTCSMTLSTQWSDGSKVERDASGTGGFYGPGDSDPCATYRYDMATKTTTFEKDGDTWTQVDNGDGTFTMTCPDGTAFDYTASESTKYNECRGITCVSGGTGGSNNGSAGMCSGIADCPGTVCCQTAAATSCVPDEMTCGTLGGTVLP